MLGSKDIGLWLCDEAREMCRQCFLKPVASCILCNVPAVLMDSIEVTHLSQLIQVLASFWDLTLVPVTICRAFNGDPSIDPSLSSVFHCWIFLN